MTALAAVPRADSELNGVIVRVKPSDLPKFDAREKRYKRERVPLSQLRLLDSGASRGGKSGDISSRARLTEARAAGLVLHDNDRVWIYVAEEQARPTPELPIAESYVDLFLAGCLKYGREFAT
jgi:hypothetical protein